MGGKNPELTIAQLRSATRVLVPVWHAGGRCSRALAEAIAAQLRLTQERNAKARAAHRKKTIQRLRGKGVLMKDLIKCRWLGK